MELEILNALILQARSFISEAFITAWLGSSELQNSESSLNLRTKHENFFSFAQVLVTSHKVSSIDLFWVFLQVEKAQKKKTKTKQNKATPPPQKKTTKNKIYGLNSKRKVLENSMFYNFTYL